MMREAMILTAAVLFLLGCGSNGNGGTDDAGGDQAPDPGQDPGMETIEDPVGEEAPAEPVRQCVIPCTSETQCCVTAFCGTYPDKWTCDGTCRFAGCTDDAECREWATRRGLDAPDGYKCRAAGDGGVPRCVAGCVTEAECCPPDTDCSSYPSRYVCSGGSCFLDGCTGDEECRTYAAGRGLHAADAYVCRPASGEGLEVCVQSCSSAGDCCPPDRAPCDTLPDHYACAGGVCTLTCSTDEECRQLAAAGGLPLADQYVCREM